MEYSKDTKVPRLAKVRKIIIANEIFALLKASNLDKSHHDGLVSRYIQALNDPKERKYAEFWWARECANPSWRWDDPNQGRRI